MKQFIIIPNKLISEGTLSYGAIILLSFLHSNSKKLGYSYATNKYYANMIRCSARKVTYLIKELNDLNNIRIENPKSLLLKKRFFLKIFSQSSPKKK